MSPLPQRLALQVGLVFCLIATVAGLAAEIGVTTVIMRAVLVGLAGACIGAGIGALILWMGKIAADLPEIVPADDAPPAKEALPEADAAAEALPAAEAPALSEGSVGG